MDIDPAISSVSIVIPLYNEEENIREVCYQIEAALSSLKLSFEIIFVDDGSKDKTYEILKEIAVRDPRIKIIKLAKNYGQLYAFLTGFEFAKGEIIITMDGDLQNDPYDIPRLLEKIKRGFDIVSGWRYNREDPLIRRLISKIFNWLMMRKTGIALHDYGCALTAIRKELINKLKGYGRNARFIKPLLVGLADSVAEIKVTHRPRKKGASKYNLVKVIKLGLDFLFNFSLNHTRIKNKNNLYCIIEKIING